MASTSLDDEDCELTEKEWREMRRRMTSLEFEPVPETPELLPRSLYGDATDTTEIDQRLAHADGNKADLFSEPSSPLDVAMLESSAASVGDASTTVDSVSSAWTAMRADERETTDALSVGKEKPTRSPGTPHKAVLPLTAASLKSSRRRSLASPVTRPRRSGIASPNEDKADESPLTVSGTSLQSATSVVDLADLESTIVLAQEQLRLTVLSAVRETTSRHERTATLERRKLEAAHANRVALLQTQLDELQTHTQTQQLQNREATQTLERATRLMMKWKQRERSRWRVIASFQAWKSYWQLKQHARTQEHFASQFQKKQSQQIALQQWKLQTQQTAFDKQLQTQRDDHSRAIESIKSDYETQLQQLRDELQAARESASAAQHGREQLEGDLRQVFLRGVSAMNIEALTLFKANHQQRLARLQENGQEGAPQPSTRRQEDREETQQSGELPSDEQMVPIREPTEMRDDPRWRLQSALPNGSSTPPTQAVLPSSAVANRLLKHAGSAEIVSPSSSAETPLPAPPPPTAAIHGLRSAELVEAHQRLLHATTAGQPTPSSTTPHTSSDGRSLSPIQQRVRAQSTMRFNVEMELMRSSVAASAALTTRYPVTTATTTATTSSAARLTGSIHGSALGTMPSSLTRRASSFSSPSTSKWRT